MVSEELKRKISHSIDIIRLASDMSQQYYRSPLIITYSGGKDSDVLADLAIRSGADIEFLNSHTTVDAPETVYHIRNRFLEFSSYGYKATVKKPEKTMWKLIEDKGMPPTRICRYCCSSLKENSTPNRYIATGVRGEESRKRSERNEFEIRGNTSKTSKRYDYEHVDEVYREAQKIDEVYDCLFITAAKRRKDLICNPIFRWTESDVWNYIHMNGIKTNPLYERGYARVGCIGCPLASKSERSKKFSEYPTYKNAYIHAFEKMIARSKSKGKIIEWKNGEEVFNWWIEDENIPGQMRLEDLED